MVGLKQQFAVARILRECHELAGTATRERGLAPEIGIDPQAPFSLE